MCIEIDFHFMYIANKFTLFLFGQTNRHSDGEMKCFPSEVVLYKHRQWLGSVGNQVRRLSDMFALLGTIHTYRQKSPFFTV